MFQVFQSVWKCAVCCAFAVVCLAQSDPGPRQGPAAAGKPLPDLTDGERNFFLFQGTPTFSEVESIADGLGPRFNLDSCGGCHIQPALGGSSPATNPQSALAAVTAPGNTVPYFIQPTGPVRVARFLRNADGSADGGVHDVFTITGRPDKPAGCSIQQPDFEAARLANNIIFRIPTPTFGAGLIEAITETTIENSLASDPGGRKAALGIRGHVNRSGNDGTVARFGWKAQNKSLLMFAGEAYNVELGVTNELFPNQREEDPGCAKVAAPASHLAFTGGSVAPSDIMSFMGFMKFLDQPAPVSSFGGVDSASIDRGRGIFVSVGCSLCHTPTLPTGASTTAALANRHANLFSDLAVHHMGATLADGVTQGAAGPDEFRTAPLWGIGQRLFFLHDGRTADLLEAIQAHFSGPGPCGPAADAPAAVTDSENGLSPARKAALCRSEANGVIRLFNGLAARDKQDLLNFLRSL